MKVFGAALAATLALACPAVAADKNYTLATASPNGFWQTIGAGVDSAVRAAMPGTVVTLQTSGGGLANAMLLSQKKANLGFIHSAELRMAKAGEAPFKAPVTNLRIIAQLYDNAATHLVMPKAFAEKYGIKTVSDVAQKKPPIRIAVNKLGNIASAAVVNVFTAAGFSLDDVKAWGGDVVYAGSAQQVEMLRDRRIDMLTTSVLAPASTVSEAAEGIDIVLLGMSDDIVRKVDAMMSATRVAIPALTYPWQKDDLAVTGLSMSLAVNAEMSDDEAYALTKALISHVDKVRASHPGLKNASPADWVKESQAPYHPGALRAYREAGVKF